MMAVMVELKAATTKDSELKGAVMMMDWLNWFSLVFTSSGPIFCGFWKLLGLVWSWSCKKSAKTGPYRTLKRANLSDPWMWWVEIVTGNPGVFQLYPYPYPPNPYPWPGVQVLEGKCTGLHGFGEFGGFGKFCRLMSLKTYIHICIA